MWDRGWTFDGRDDDGATVYSGYGGYYDGVAWVWVRGVPVLVDFLLVLFWGGVVFLVAVYWLVDDVFVVVVSTWGDQWSVDAALDGFVSKAVASEGGCYLVVFFGFMSQHVPMEM